MQYGLGYLSHSSSCIVVTVIASYFVKHCVPTSTISSFGFCNLSILFYLVLDSSTLFIELTLLASCMVLMAIHYGINLYIRLL